MPIRVTQTDSEFLVEINFKERDRAKGIQGRRWDGDRKAWVFPRNRQVYEALIAEFGDDADLTISPMSGWLDPPSRPGVADQIRVDQVDQLGELEPIKTSLVEARNTLEEKVLELNQVRGENKRLLAELADLKKEISDTKANLGESLEDLAKMEALLDKKVLELEDLRRRRHRPSADGVGTATETLEERVRRDALASGVGEPFRKMISAKNHTDISGVARTYVALEKLLRDELKMPKANLFELLREAKEKELLNPQALDLCHVIRVQRNLMMHPSGIDASTIAVRATFVLLAAYLLWPDLEAIR